MTEQKDEEDWRLAHEACVSAVGSMLMSAVGHPDILVEGLTPDDLAAVIIECAAAAFFQLVLRCIEHRMVCRATTALVGWMGNAEPFVSAAGMRAQDRYARIWWRVLV